MCGRYVNKLGEAQYSLFEINDIRLPKFPPRPRYNVAPTTKIPVVISEDAGRRALVEMRWGLRPSWAKPDQKLPPMINARSETVATLASFRRAFAVRRCIVPASGYYEWRAGKVKQPFYFEPRDEQPIAFAALWEHNVDAGDTVCTITTTPNAEASAIHDRMPVILAPASWARWLTPDPLSDDERLELLRPAPDGFLKLHPVDRAVGKVGNDTPELITPLSEETPLQKKAPSDDAQGSLF